MGSPEMGQVTIIRVPAGEPIHVSMEKNTMFTIMMTWKEKQKSP